MARSPQTKGKRRSKAAPAPEKAPRPPRGLWVWLAVALVLAALAGSFLPFIADDALISLRYADRLLAGQGLTWTDGERVEGYSNLLWVLANALLGLVGLDLVVAARLLGLAGMLAVPAALLRRRGPDEGPVPALVAGLAFAVCGPVAVWTVGGLEQPLLAGLLAWAAVSAFPLLEPEPGTGAWRRPGALLALLCWTRPDGVLFAAGAAAGLVWARGLDAVSRRLAARLLALPVGACLLQLVFRLVYYGAWLPNSAAAKLAFTGHRVTEGLAYVGFGLLWLGPLLLPAGAVVAGERRQPVVRDRARLLLPILLLWVAYVATVGGDGFPARRHMVPVAVIAALLLAEGLAAARGGESARWKGVLTATTVCVAGLAVVQYLDPETVRARTERWEWDGELVGNMLGRSFPDDTLLAADPAGTLPYFSKLPAIDMLGLNDRHLATHRPDDFGSGPLGHELGDGAYVLDREPDLVVFCGPGGGARPCFRSGQEMVADPRFAERYAPVLFEVEGRRRSSYFRRGDTYSFRSLIWVRREGGRAGVRREDDAVRVPGYFMNRVGDQVARPDNAGRLVLVVDEQRPAGLERLPLEPGRWNMQIESEGPLVRAMVRASDGEVMLGGGYGGAAFEIPAGPGPVPVDVLVLAGDPSEASRVSGVVFTRDKP